MRWIIVVADGGNLLLRLGEPLQVVPPVALLTCRIRVLYQEGVGSDLVVPTRLLRASGGRPSTTCPPAWPVGSGPASVSVSRGSRGSCPGPSTRGFRRR